MGAVAGNTRQPNVLDGRFWFSLGVVLLATAWVPMVSLEVTGPDGTARQHLVPVYRCYQSLLSEPSLIAAAAILIHVTLCFVISYAMRRLVLLARTES